MSHFIHYRKCIWQQCLYEWQGEGNVIAKGILHLQAQARLYGDIEVSSIVTDEGAIFQGGCKMIELPEDEAAVSSSRRSRSRLKIRHEDLDDGIDEL